MHSCFADKDDLKSGNGAEYVDKSSAVLVFGTAMYFESRACARELFRALLLKKPLIVVLEPDAKRGSLSREAIRSLLTKQRFNAKGEPDDNGEHTWVSKWGLDGEVAAWGYPSAPTGEEIAAALFSDEDPIEWNRFTAFQAITLRLIVERLLTQAERKKVFVQGELGAQALSPPSLARGRTFHLYCSPNNEGAREVGDELNELLVKLNKHEGEPLLKTTTSLDDLDQCEHMLLYLTAKTWTNGEHSKEFAREIAKSARKGVHLLLVHEFPSVVDEGQRDGTKRGACDFNDFWNEGWTPTHLKIGPANIYKQIALALKPGLWRAAGLATVLSKLSEGASERVPIELSEEAEEKALKEHVPAVLQPKATADEHGGHDRHSSANRKTKADAPSYNELRAHPKQQLMTSKCAQQKPAHASPALAGGESPSPPGGIAPSLQVTSQAPHRARPKSSARPSPGEHRPCDRPSRATPSAAASLASVHGSIVGPADVACAALRRSVSAHDARRTSLNSVGSQCTVASPFNAVHASLPSASPLPQPSNETRTTQRRIRVVRSASTQPDNSASVPTVGGSRPPQSPGTPAYLERDDEDETAIDRGFDHVEEPSRVPVRASRTVRRNGNANGRLGGGGHGRVAI